MTTVNIATVQQTLYRAAAFIRSTEPKSTSTKYKNWLLLSVRYNDSVEEMAHDIAMTADSNFDEAAFIAELRV